jgi:hypothetical protein
VSTMKQGNRELATTSFGKSYNCKIILYTHRMTLLFEFSSGNYFPSNCDRCSRTNNPIEWGVVESSILASVFIAFLYCFSVLKGILRARFLLCLLICV